jgi:hypothetical protein
MRVMAVLLGIALVAALGCGGDDGEDTAPAEAASGGLSIDPDSGPPGTTVSWSISGCEARDEKGVAIYAAPLEEYRSGAQARRVAESPRGTRDSGTIAVPEGAAPGEYTITGSCLSREELGQGQIQLGVKEETVGFTVTG